MKIEHEDLLRFVIRMIQSTSNKKYSSKDIDNLAEYLTPHIHIVLGEYEKVEPIMKSFQEIEAWANKTIEETKENQ